MDHGLTFPRQYARTQRFTLGQPRDIAVSPDGRRVVFARSRAGDDPVNCLWTFDVLTGEERMVADPLALGEQLEEDLPAEERAQRERMRESAAGVTSFATDEDMRVAAFSLAGRLHVADLIGGTARATDIADSVVDPRPAPDASRLAYLSGRTLRIAELDGSSWELAGEADTDVSWGSAEFVAAEEMNRLRGYWWSPDSQSIAACRVDNSPVHQWFIGNPAEPGEPPTAVRYPAAGTPNATVTLHVLALEGAVVEVSWDSDEYPYLTGVSWPEAGRLLVSVMSRDQHHLAVLEADPATGVTEALFEDFDDAWVELVPGVPSLLPDGRMVTAADRGGARRLMIDGTPVTPADLQVRSVAACDEGGVTFVANQVDDATVTHVWRWNDGDLRNLTDHLGDGTHGAVVGGPQLIIRRAALGVPGATTLVGTRRLTSVAETPLVRPNVAIHHLGDRRTATAILLPHNHDGTPLPVLVDSYAGPHSGRVVSANDAYLSSQWFADQGFAVLVIDGRGTPGRGTDAERAIHLNLAGPVLDDQVAAVQFAAEVAPLDLSKVAIRGWSFGGYLAALAVLDRPDVFHAAVAGAPVTEWRLYDTFYTERYLGDPNDDAGPYAAASLLPRAHLLSRPLLLIHGLADDNVVAAHTLQLSQALLAAGRPHEVLPLVGVTHMTPQEVVAENLLLHQLDFLRRSLGLTTG